MAYKFDCRLFTGYKPCVHKRPCDGCGFYEPVQKRIAVVSLEALGAVLRSTVILKPLRKKYPGAHITWITYPNAKALLQNNPEIDRLIALDATTNHVFDHLKFDVLCAVDKSLEAGALAERIQAKEKFGFGLTEAGAIRTFNPEANYQYDVGLDDHLKFIVNQKPETQQITESMALNWTREPYILTLTEEEKTKVKDYSAQLRRKGVRGVIGYNTGCSILYPFKKLTVERSIEVIRMWRETFPDFAVALLGGREDEERQRQMKTAFRADENVIDTPTTGGLREGILWMAATDIVFSGCSLGLHIAIALQKPVIAWFGVSCIQEIDHYDRGIKIQSDVSCSPCWKKTCNNEPKCFNQVAPGVIQKATREVIGNFIR